VSRQPEKSGLLARVAVEEAEDAISIARRPDADLEDELLAVIGHDLRSPLSVVTMTADALARTATDDASRTTARRLRSAGDRMLRMLEELVDLARVRRGVALPLDVAPSDIGAICASVVADLSVPHPGRLAFEAQPGELTVEIDLVRVTRAVESLLSSALRNSGKKDTITVKTAEEEERVVVIVSMPIALDEATIARAFEPFMLTDDGRIRSDGASLGMFVAREVARAHGGTAEVRSEPTGTTYRLGLPRRRA
jgi:signal transduction histidine kinase